MDIRNKSITLHPHHGACIVNYIGNGYSRRFNERMAELIALLEENPNTMVNFTFGADTLCNSCPNLQSGDCISLEKVRNIDKRWLEATGLDINGSIEFGKFVKITENIMLDGSAFNSICGCCEWYELCLRVIENRKNQAVK